MSRARRSVSKLGARLFTLQAKLVVAMTALIVLAVLATGAIFVLRSKDERERQALDRIAATAPLVYQTLPGAAAGSFAYTAGVAMPPPVQYGPNLDRLALDRDVRILIVGDQNVVAYDTGGGGLQGFHLSFPPVSPDAYKRGFLAWQPGRPVGDLTFITPAPPGPFTTVRVPSNAAGADATAAGQVQLGTIATEGTPASIETAPAGATEAPPFAVTGVANINLGPPPPYGGWGQPAMPYNVVLAVPSRDITDAWLSALPGVGIAGGIALPFAILAAVIIARQVARPIHQLTLASEAMAQGDFDQRVEVARSDEVGRLAQAFSTMAERVGERDVQMRALVANVSHDLKTPMTSIMGYAQALQDGLIEPERLPHVARVIHDQAATTNLLLTDLLFLSEVDAGQALPSHQDIAASQLAAGAIERMQAAADQKGVSILLSADDSVCAGVDAEKLTRALANVIHNAVRFSPAGATVTVETSNAGGEVEIEVTNTGPRIDEDDLPLIFERYFRGAAGTSGHGLGLAIAREAVELSGGRIEAHNTPAGVAVVVAVPRKDHA